jgi:peroxiredoxin Q/BCP
MLQIHSQAPDFELQDEKGEKHSLSQYSGSWVLLYFYPKDDTPGCTVEACTLRDIWDDLKKENITVLGVSADSTESHSQFKEKYTLPFTLLSDTSKEIIEKYGALKEENKGIKRMSYLINPEGSIEKIYTNVQPDKHAIEVLQDVKELK